MPSLGFYETLASASNDGTAITAAARTSMTVAATGARFTMPSNKLRLGDQFHLQASGRISCVVTTPGTARFDLAAGATVVFDSLAMPLNIVAKTNVSWVLDVLGTVRAIGTAANILWQGHWLSEASILTALPATGPGPGGQMVPYNTAPVVGASFDSTVTSLWDFFFTQTVSTGSCQIHQYSLGFKTSNGF